MLADAHYLQEKFSVLKNVGAPTNILSNFVAEKPLPRKSAFSNIRASASPNERIKGLLSRKDSAKADKPLPAVSSPALSLPPPQETPPDDVTAEEDRNERSSLDHGVVQAPPRGSSRGAIGFEQAEPPCSKIDITEKDDLPPIPEDGSRTLSSEMELSGHVTATGTENEAASTPSQSVEEHEAGDSRDEVPPAVATLPCDGDRS